MRDYNSNDLLLLESGLRVLRDNSSERLVRKPVATERWVLLLRNKERRVSAVRSRPRTVRVWSNLRVGDSPLFRDWALDLRLVDRRELHCLWPSVGDTDADLSSPIGSRRGLGRSLQNV